MIETARPARQDEKARLSSSDQIVRDIVRGLYEGRFVAGQRLVEPDLMRLYGVSRGTVREAIKRLAAEGVVTQTTFRGAQIRHLSRADAVDILQLLEVTIGLAARLAAENLDARGMREHFSTAYLNLMTFADTQDSFEFVRARNRFYHAMTRAAGNRELARLVPSFQVHLIRTHLRQRQQERFADYRAMAEAILSGNGKAAETAARNHIGRIMAALEAMPDATFAPAAPATAPRYDEDFDNA